MPPKNPGGATQTATEDVDPNRLENRVILERTLNFLADEDLHRKYDFLAHLEALKEYLEKLFLEYIGPRASKPLDFEVEVWEQALLMVKTHLEWIRKDDMIRPFDWSTIKLLLEERTHILPIRPVTGVERIPEPVQLPNIAIPKEIPLSLALPPDDPGREELVDPLRYTKKAAQHRRLKEYAAAHVEDERKPSHIPTRANFHGPHLKSVSRLEVRVAKTSRTLHLVKLIEKLQATQAEAPRALLRKVNARVQQGQTVPDGGFDSNMIIDDTLEDWQQWTTSAEAVSPLTEEEFQLLSILTESSWDANGRTSQNPQAEKDKHPEDRYHIVGIPDQQLDITKTVRYNGDGDIGPQITMDSWTVFQRLGYRLGSEHSRLRRTAQDTKAGEQAREAKFEDLIENLFPELSLDEIIKPALPRGQRTDTWTASEKMAVLRNEITKEALRADPDRALDHKKLWQFAESKAEAGRPFFSVSRWPIEIMTREARNDMAANAPIRDRRADPIKLTPEEMAAVEKENVRAYFAPPPRERFIRGYPHYPFGETRTQEIVLSNQIANDLAGVEGYDFFPEERAGFWSSLNPVNWWRKRKAEEDDDGNEEGGKKGAFDDDDEDEDAEDSDEDMGL